MACGFVYYFNPSSAVACFIKNAKGELLLVRRGKEPAKGTLDVSYFMIYNSIKNNKPHLNIDAACLISQMSFRYTQNRI